MNRDAPGDVNRFGEVLELALNVLVQVWKVKGEGQGHGGGREEDVGGDVEFVGDVEGVGAEEIDDEGGYGAVVVLGGEEGVAEGREGAEDGEGDEGFDLGGGWEVGEGDGWEEGVGDAAGEGAEDGGLCLGGRAVGGDDEGDGEVVVEDESFGEFYHWNEVSHTWAWHHCH